MRRLLVRPGPVVGCVAALGLGALLGVRLFAATVTISIVGSSGSQAFTPNPLSTSTGNTVVWTNNDGSTHRIVLDDNSYDSGNLFPGATTPALPVPTTSKTYHCAIHPSMVGTLPVAASAAPTITTHPSSQTVATGATVQFSVAAQGSSTPAIQWQYSTDGGATFVNLANVPPHSGVTTSTLTVTAAKASLNGTRYRAVATSGGVSANSNAATLTVTSSSIALTTGDYDYDGKADLVVFRPALGFWFTLPSTSTPSSTVGFGAQGDIPLPGDYDGDGKMDRALFRPSDGTTRVTQSSNSALIVSASTALSTDVPEPGDYDGDGKADVAFYRPSTGVWTVQRSSDATVATTQLGLLGDIPAPGDYDGDGKTDPTIFRPSTGTWYALNSSAGYASSTVVQWGLSGDVPAAGGLRRRRHDGFCGVPPIDGNVVRPHVE